jgi:DNA-binding CsgD family transcriptional regulator
MAACKWVTFIFLCLSTCVHAQIFAPLKTLTSSRARIDSAERIYFYKIKRADSAFAIRELKGFVELAAELNDQNLECFSISMLADHFARIRGYNATSSALHTQAIELGRKYKVKLAEGSANYLAGRYYYNFKKFPQAFENLLKANNLFMELGYGNVPDVAYFLYFLGNTYYETGDYEKAETHFLASIRQHNDNPFQRLQAYNTMAQMHKEQKQYNKALSYLNAALKLTRETGDSTWNGLATGYIGNLFFDQHQYEKAFPYLTKGYGQNMKSLEWGSANRCLLDLAIMSLRKNDLPQAEHYLNLSKECMKHSNTIYDRKNFYEAMLLWNEKKANLPLALSFSRKLDAVKDSLSRQKNLIIYGNIQLRIETERYLSSLRQLEAESRSAELKRNAGLIILFLMLLISVLVYNRQRLKREKDAEIFLQQQAILKSEASNIQSEKLRADEELANARLLLSNYTDNLRQKTELIETFSKELEKLSLNNSVTTDNERNEHFEKLIHSTILTDKDWDNFRQLFDKVHKGFFFRLKEMLPYLSESDTRLLSLVKLQLTNREMANMLGVSIDAIKKAKQRLRKKMDLPGSEKEIEDIASSI